MKKILLTQNYQTLVDDIDYEYLNQWVWYAHKTNVQCDYVYAVRSHGYLMHRYVVERMLNRVLGRYELVDHINLDRLDNRRANLRLKTPAQNVISRLHTVDNVSGYLGVHWSKDKRKWRAATRINNKFIHIGYFDDARDAAAAYDEKIIDIHGEFARTNRSKGLL